MKKNIKKTILIAECLVLSSMMVACSFPGKKDKKNEDANAAPQSIEELISQTGELTFDGDAASNDESKEAPNEEAPSEEAPKEETPSDPNETTPVEIPDSPVIIEGADPDSMYSFNYGNKVYELPLQLSVFFDNGWTVNEKFGTVETLASGEDIELRLSYGKRTTVETQVIVINYTGSEQKIEDCTVNHISINLHTLNEAGMTCSLRDGKIVLGETSYDDIVAMYGEFDNELDAGAQKLCMYFQDGNTRNRDEYVIYTIDTETNTIRDVEIIRKL